jgi:hypothetical protein
MAVHRVVIAPQNMKASTLTASAPGRRMLAPRSRDIHRSGVEHVDAGDRVQQASAQGGLANRRKQPVEARPAQKFSASWEKSGQCRRGAVGVSDCPARSRGRGCGAAFPDAGQAPRHDVAMIQPPQPPVRLAQFI